MRFSSTRTPRQMICGHLLRSRLEKASTYYRKYASGLFEPAASHLPAAPSPDDREISRTSRKLSALSYWKTPEESEKRLSLIKDETAWKFVRDPPIHRRG